MYRPLKYLIFKNISILSFTTIWSLAINIFLTPYIVHTIGVEKFGIWIIVMILTNYMGLFDLGTNSATVKFIAELYAKKDFKGISSILFSGFIFNLVTGSILILLVLILLNPIISFFNIKHEYFHETTLIIKISIILFGVSNILNVFGSFFSGTQRFQVIKGIDFFLTFPNLIATILFLALNYGLMGLIYSRIIVVILRLILITYFLRKTFPPKSINIDFTLLSFLKPLLKFGLTMQLSSINQLISQHIDKILIAHLIGISYAAYYEIGSKINNYTKRLLINIVIPLIPASSEIYALKDMDRLWQLYNTGSRYLTIISIGVLGFIFMMSDSIIYLWMGEGFEKSRIITKILCVGFAINFIASIPQAIAIGIGKPSLELKSGTLSLIINVSLSYFLIIFMGYSGAAYGTTMAFIASSCYFYIIFLREFRKKIFQSIIFLIGPIISLVSSILFCYLFIPSIKGFFILNDKISIATFISFVGFIFVIIYFVLLVLTRSLSRKDYDFFMVLIKRFKDRDQYINA